MNWPEAFALVGGIWGGAYGLPRLLKVLITGDYK